MHVSPSRIIYLMIYILLEPFSLTGIINVPIVKRRFFITFSSATLRRNVRKEKGDKL